MADLPCSLKVLKQYQRVLLSLHLQRVTDTITAILVKIYPEPSWHLLTLAEAGSVLLCSRGDV